MNHCGFFEGSFFDIYGEVMPEIVVPIFLGKPLISKTNLEHWSHGYILNLSQVGDEKADHNI